MHPQKHVSPLVSCQGADTTELLQAEQKEGEGGAHPNHLLLPLPQPDPHRKVADPRQGEVPGEPARLENTGDVNHCGELRGHEEHRRNGTGGRPLHRVLCLHVAPFWLLASKTTTSSRDVNTQEVPDTPGPPVGPAFSPPR